MVADIKHNLILDMEQKTSSEAFNCHFLTTINLHVLSGLKAYSQGIPALVKVPAIDQGTYVFPYILYLYEIQKSMAHPQRPLCLDRIVERGRDCMLIDFYVFVDINHLGHKIVCGRVITLHAQTCHYAPVCRTVYENEEHLKLELRTQNLISTLSTKVSHKTQRLNDNSIIVML